MKPEITVLVLALLGLAALADALPKPAPTKQPELRRELQCRTKVDQEARNAWAQWMNDNGSNGVLDLAALTKEKQAEFEKAAVRMNEVDADNTKWLKGVVEKYGWLTNTLVGSDGAEAAWLLVQHADADPKFQRHCLDLMVKLPRNQVSQSNLAFLTDRVLLAEGRKQLYGTQFNYADGKWRVRPLDNESNVDKRRAEFGLPPLAEYIKQIEEQFGGKTKMK